MTTVVSTDCTRCLLLQEGDPEGWWEETFNGHRDSKTAGPEAISIDMTFPGAQHVYGIPERATNLALKPTAGDTPTVARATHMFACIGRAASCSMCWVLAHGDTIKQMCAVCACSSASIAHLNKLQLELSHQHIAVISRDPNCFELLGMILYHNQML